MFLTSFRTNADIRINKTTMLPETWTLEGYIKAFTEAPLGRWFFNSILITTIVTAAVIFTSTLIGYVFAKYEFKMKKMLFLLLLATMMVPGQVTMIPRFLMIQEMGLFNTQWALIIPGMVSALGIFTAMMSWNDYLNPLLMLNDKEKMTLPLALVVFSTEHTQDLTTTMAAATMIMLPMIVIFILFQKQFIRGLALSGIK